MKITTRLTVLLLVLAAVAAAWSIRLASGQARSAKAGDGAGRTDDASKQPNVCDRHAAMAEYIMQGDAAVPELRARLQACPKTDGGYLGSGPWWSAVLSRIGSPAAVDALTSALESLPDNDHCVAYIDIAKNLGRLGPSARKAIPVLEDRLHAHNPLVRAASAAAMAQIDPILAKERALPVVLDDARSGEALRQCGASLALPWIGPVTPEAAQAIETLNKGPYAYVSRWFETEPEPSE